MPASISLAAAATATVGSAALSVDPIGMDKAWRQSTYSQVRRTHIEGGSDFSDFIYVYFHLSLGR